MAPHARAPDPHRQPAVGTTPSGDGAWDGIFYPPRGRRHRPKGFDELEYYAPALRYRRGELDLLRRAAPRGHRRPGPTGRPMTSRSRSSCTSSFTHPKMFAAATRSGGTRPESTSVPTGAPPKIDRGDVDRFREAIAPLHEAGKLGALLAQFPASFKNDATAHDHLAWLIEALSDCPVAVELRHRSWSDDVAGTLRLLNGLGAAWVQIDEPKFRLSIAQNWLPNVESFYYMRLHGRNARKWWRHDRTEERYDYHYSAAELEPFRDTARRRGPPRQAPLPLHEQPLRREGGGQRRHPEAPARPGGGRRVPRGDGVALPGARWGRQDGARAAAPLLPVGEPPARG